MCYHYCNCIQIILHIHSVIMSIILLIVPKYIFMINLFSLRRTYLTKISSLFYPFINERTKKNIKNIGINKYGLWWWQKMPLSFAWKYKPWLYFRLYNLRLRSRWLVVRPLVVDWRFFQIWRSLLWMGWAPQICRPSWSARNTRKLNRIQWQLDIESPLNWRNNAFCKTTV